MKIKIGKRVFRLISGLLLLSASGAAQSFDFVSLDVEGAKQTVYNGIGPGGDIVGTYVDEAGKSHGFLLRRGKFTTIDVPDSLVGIDDNGTLPTSANGINSAGEIVGNYIAPLSSAPVDSPSYCPAAGSPACTKGFLYSHGHFSTVLFPGHPGAIPQRITPDGDIYGCLHDTDLMMSMFGAVWTRFGDISLKAGGGELANPSQSVPISMNNGATPDGHMIVGLYNDMNAHRHGFVVQDGVFQSYDVPGSTLTAIWDVNPGQEFVGTYVDGAGHRHGFLQLSDAPLPITVDYPGAAATIVEGINAGGAMVGQYTASGHVHGFLAVPQ